VMAAISSVVIPEILAMRLQIRQSEFSLLSIKLFVRQMGQAS
jgi:hypothetical protein